MRLRIQRYEPGRDPSPSYQVYDVSDIPGQTVLGALFEIQDTQDGSLAFRYSCRGAVCGSCAMLINKFPRLACRTQLKEVMEASPSRLEAFGPMDGEAEGWDPETEVLVEPLPNFPVTRDLVVNMTRFWDALEEVEPWLVPDEEPPEGRERPMKPDQVLKLERFVGCLLCGLCSGSCPVANRDQEFLGPAALAKARRFYEDPRDVRRDGIIEMLDNEEGLRGCDLIYNCVKVCPRNVAPGGAIRKMKDDASKLPNLSDVGVRG
jgi:succinate dehydrogenase / fumarate reductase iron-sulfur subunit